MTSLNATNESEKLGKKMDAEMKCKIVWSQKIIKTSYIWLTLDLVDPDVIKHAYIHCCDDQSGRMAIENQKTE